jgi:hypothetical protein
MGKERFHPAKCAGWCGGLTAQADRIAGAKRKKKVGSLRSEWPAFAVLRRVSLASAGLRPSQDSSLRSE